MAGTLHMQDATLVSPEQCRGEIIADLGLDTIDKNGNGKVDYIMIEGDPENVDAKYRTRVLCKSS